MHRIEKHYLFVDKNENIRYNIYDSLENYGGTGVIIADRPGTSLLGVSFYVFVRKGVYIWIITSVILMREIGTTQ